MSRRSGACRVVKATFFAFLLSLSPAARAGDAKPGWAVVVVIDQMRADYLDRFSGEFKDGFRRLLDDGARFSNAVIPYVPTNTAPGHAAIATGLPPKDTGIVGNRWWDREAETIVAAINDPEHGVSPRRLLSGTVGDRLRAEDPSATVISLSLKDRSAVLMGGARPTAAVWFDRRSGGFRTSPYYESPAWLEAFNESHRAWSGSARPSGASVEAFLGSPEADALLMDLTSTALGALADDARAARGILWLSFSGLDYVGHRHGPDSPAVKTHLMALDGLLGRLLDELETAFGPDGYRLVLTSDHGIAPLPGSPEGPGKRGSEVSIDRFRGAVEAAIQREFPIPERSWLRAFEPPHVWLRRELADELRLPWRFFIGRVATALISLPDVADVYTPLKPGVSDVYRPFYAAGFHPGRSGDVMLRLEYGVVVKKYHVGTTHGTAYDYDARIPIVLFGAGIEQARITSPVALTDVAATVASWLDLDWSAKAGRPLSGTALK